MKINKNLIIELLQNELIYERNEHKTALADLGLEQTIMDNMERSRTFYKNKSECMEQQLFELNTDFYDLGDLLMEVIKQNAEKQQEQKLTPVSEAFIAQQAQKRIDYLEEVIFDFGDESQDLKKELAETTKDLQDFIADTAEVISDLRKDIEDIQADWAKEESDWGLASKMRSRELEDKRRIITDLKDEIEMKARVDKEAIYADKKCKYDLEQKIIALQKENVGLIKLLGELQETGQTEKNPIAQKDTDVTTRLAGATETADKEPTTKPRDPRDTKEISMITCKNKLCNKGYAVKIEGNMLVATKDGTRKIEVGHAELPGSLKYTVCGQTCFEFEKAVKASAYGVKAILPKAEIETGAVS